MSKESEKIRVEWLRNDTLRDEGLTERPDVVSEKNISYGTAGEWNLLDIYRPKAETENGKKLPVLVSIHGGGYVYGTKEIYKFYLMYMASHGFACINFNYRLAPENTFPSALEDTNLVIKWIFENKEKYNLDTEHIFLTGDSAGAHYVSLFSLLCTSEEYRNLIGIIPYNNFIPKAVLLNCGAYGADSSRKNDLLEDLLGNRIKEAQTLLCVDKYINKNFPQCFVMTGYYDFLKESGILMDKLLSKTAVPHVFKIYGDKNAKESGHVFHVNQKLSLAKICNDDEAEFLKSFLI